MPSLALMAAGGGWTEVADVLDVRFFRGMGERVDGLVEKMNAIAIVMENNRSDPGQVALKRILEMAERRSIDARITNKGGATVAITFVLVSEQALGGMRYALHAQVLALSKVAGDAMDERTG